MGGLGQGTRALIPRLKPYCPVRGSGGRSGRPRQNGEPIIAALLFLGLYILYGPLS
jgi:hypothetical protein